MKHQWRSLLILSLLVACQGQPSPTPTPEPTATPVPSTPTPLVLPPTWTPTQPPPTATSTSTSEPQATATVGTPTAIITPTATLTPTTTTALTDRAEFVSDVTVPDGAPFPAGTVFTKTWRLKNVGTATWTKDYALVYVSGEKMNGPDRLSLPSEVPPGQTVDISIPLTAPSRLAFYTGFWQLQNGQGAFFGIGPEANQPIYVQIQVTTSGNATPVPGGPPAPAGTLRITSASVSVLSATVTAPCPYVFAFTGSFTSEGAGTATYRLEARSDTPGFVFDLPAPFDSTFTDAGPRPFFFAYNLEFRNSVSGQVWVHVLTPADLQSSPLNFSLTCQP